MTQVEILKAGLNALRTKGWRQEVYGYSATVPSCLVGGLMFGLRKPFVTSLFGRYVNCGHIPEADMFCAVHYSVGPLLCQLAGVPEGEALERWNDQLGRTWPEVEALLTAAIAIAEEQEQANPLTEELVTVTA